MPRFTSRTVLALVIALVLWASAFAGIRAGLRAYTPANLAVLRFLVASAVLIVYAGVAHFRRPSCATFPDWRYAERSESPSTTWRLTTAKHTSPLARPAC